MNKNITKAIDVMGRVYGPYSGSSTNPWRPQPYADNKSRYLWTDSFGVCNYISLYYETGKEEFLAQADALIEDVHNTLGKNREGTARLGNASDEAPLLGGLRIGKRDPEGTPDGDGQYFHYLTKWMFALNRMSYARKIARYNDWAVQMAQSIHPKFVNRQQMRMYWKMSIDLNRPAVRSQGNLDPFDGYITYRLLQERHTELHPPKSEEDKVLIQEINDMKNMMEDHYRSYQSSDPLDLGEALWITHWYPDESWSKHVQNVSMSSLEVLWRCGYFNPQETRHRLGFREFGTTIGVQVVSAQQPNSWISEGRVEQLHQFWEPRLYKRDRDITPVMYVTSLIPGVFSKSFCANHFNK